MKLTTLIAVVAALTTSAADSGPFLVTAPPRFIANSPDAATPPRPHTVPAESRPASRAVPGYHTHRCRRCGTEWSHGATANGIVSAHTCHKCGQVEWDKAPVSVRLPISTTLCPGGVCPTTASPTRRRLFR